MHSTLKDIFQMEEKISTFPEKFKIFLSEIVGPSKKRPLEIISLMGKFINALRIQIKTLKPFK